jgi:ELWxxDGT repeat protein
MLFPGSPRGSSLFDFTPFAGRLFFTADDGSNGPELWTSDGTATGTRLVSNIHPLSSYISPRPSALTVVGNQLLFLADDGTKGKELWRTDSTLQTTQVRDIGPGSSDGITGSEAFLAVLRRPRAKGCCSLLMMVCGDRSCGSAMAHPTAPPC